MCNNKYILCLLLYSSCVHSIKKNIILYFHMHLAGLFPSFLFSPKGGVCVTLKCQWSTYWAFSVQSVPNALVDLICSSYTNKYIAHNLLERQQIPKHPSVMSNIIPSHTSQAPKKFCIQQSTVLILVQGIYKMHFINYWRLLYIGQTSEIWHLWDQIFIQDSKPYNRDNSVHTYVTSKIISQSPVLIYYSHKTLYKILHYIYAYLKS
jgi:hypothetical protein